MRIEPIKGNPENVGPIAEALQRSVDPCDHRKAACLVRLDELHRGLWRGRLTFRGFGVREDRALVTGLGLGCAGLAWPPEADAPQVLDRWRLGLVLPPRYPFAMPSVCFEGVVPFCPHVVHQRFGPGADVPLELERHLREGHGHVCLIAGADWSPDAVTHGLATLIWQLSRILTMGRFHGEAASLNRQALDWALAHPERLPLGPALPYPHAEGPAPDADRAADEAIDILE